MKLPLLILAMVSPLWGQGFKCTIAGQGSEIPCPPTMATPLQPPTHWPKCSHPVLLSQPFSSAIDGEWGLWLALKDCEKEEAKAKPKPIVRKKRKPPVKVPDVTITDYDWNYAPPGLFEEPDNDYPNPAEYDTLEGWLAAFPTHSPNSDLFTWSDTGTSAVLDSMGPCAGWFAYDKEDKTCHLNMTFELGAPVHCVTDANNQQMIRCSYTPGQSSDPPAAAASGYWLGHFWYDIP